MIKVTNNKTPGPGSSFKETTSFNPGPGSDSKEGTGV